MKDLYVLVADLSMRQTVDAALRRPQALTIRPLSYKIDVHPNRDNGIRTTGPQLLTLMNRQYTHGLLILDYEGSGTNKNNAIALEAELDTQLERSWNQNAKAIVIEPELEIWMWGTDNSLRESLEWPEKKNLRSWLTEQGVSFHPNHKPVRPKEAFEMVLYELKCRKSSTLYGNIASKISMKNCTDASFLRFRDTLSAWFNQKS